MPTKRHVSTEDIAALDRQVPFAAQCQARGLTLAGADVFTLAPGSPTAICRAALTCLFWSPACPKARRRWPMKPSSSATGLRPLDMLARHEAGTFFMIFPTLRNWNGWQSTWAVLNACAHEKPLWISARAGLLGGQDARYMEIDSPYGELALTSPDGQRVHSLGWQSERPWRS